MSIKKLSIFAFLFLLFSTQTASAAGLVPSCGEAGDCKLNDFLQLAIIITNWLFGIVGSVVLLFFIYGGILFIFSSGESSKVEKGKDIIVGSIVGLVIMFSSYVIIQFAMSALGVNGSWSTSGWFSK